MRTERTDQTAELKRERNNFIRYSIVATVFFIAICALLALVNWNAGIETACLAIALIPLVYTWMPLAGYQRRLRQMREE